MTPITLVAPDIPAAVSAADERSFEILASLRQVFAEKGFDGASMQDLARAAGMSVGNFYRYFPSKAAIVAGMVELDLREVRDHFAAILQSDDLMSALRFVLHQRISEEECAGEGQLWAEITAASMRKPDIAAACQQMETEIAGYLTAVFAKVTGISAGEALARYRAHAQLIVMLVKGAAMRPDRISDHSSELTRLVLRTIDRTLDEISADARGPELPHATKD